MYAVIIMYRFRPVVGDNIEADQIERRLVLLIIKRIEIKGFENVNRFEASFGSRFVILPGQIAVAITNAIGVALKSRILAGEAPGVNSNTFIRAEIEKAGETFSVVAHGSPEMEELIYEVSTENGNRCFDFFRRIHQSREEEILSFFVLDRSNRFSDRLMRYKDPEKYFPGDSFKKLTDGIGNTRSFRLCLGNYIRKYVPEYPAFNRDCRIVLDKTGRFILESSAGAAPAAVSGTEDMLFEYLCFLNVNQFWKKVEAIRDLNHAAWPLFIKGLSGTESASEYLQKALPLDRQVFVV